MKDPDVRQVLASDLQQVVIRDRRLAIAHLELRGFLNARLGLDSQAFK
jgi:hypothetical protein